MLTDQDLATEVLTLEKSLSSIYHFAVQESSTEPLHSELKSNLNDVICKESDTFNLMAQKGWYQIEQVPMPQIEKVKTKFAQDAQSAK